MRKISLALLLCCAGCSRYDQEALLGAAIGAGIGAGIGQAVGHNSASTWTGAGIGSGLFMGDDAFRLMQGESVINIINH